MDLSTSAIAISRREVLCASGVAALSALVAGVAGCAATTSPPPAVSADPSKAQITVLYDAFGKASAMQKGLGVRRAHRLRWQAHPVRHRQQPRDPGAEREGQERRPVQAGLRRHVAPSR